MRLRAGLVAFAWLVVAAAPSSAGAVSLQQVGGFFPGAIYVSSDPGNPDRLLVADRNGRILQFENGVTTVLADFEAEVRCCENEQGLLSFAPAPDFGISGRLYVDYTGVEEVGGRIHVAEVIPGEPPTLRDLLEIPHPVQKVHYGGQLQFGPEGNLFISTGDGGPANDPDNNAQDLETLLGKILRITPDPSEPDGHDVPSDNPFFGEPDAEDEIWSYGLRNPFRFSFDRLTGAIAISDVGQSQREEVNFAPAPLLGAGANYGWRCREGLAAGPGTDPACVGATDLVDPVFDYQHGEGDGPCAIIGGFVSRDPQVPELFGRYVYGDFCTGAIHSVDLSSPFATDRVESVSPPGLTSFGEDAAGRLYVVAGGAIYRLVGSPQSGDPAPPRALARLGLKAISRPLRRGGRATLLAFVSPCVRDRARSVEISLLRGRKRLDRRNLSRACTATFRPRVTRRAKFQVKLVPGDVYLDAESRKLTIKPKPRKRRR
jgi:hypothetical protein